MHIEIKQIGSKQRKDINIPNQPFPLKGRMLVTLTEQGWQHREELLPVEQITYMTFPDENYDFDRMKDYIFLGAYQNDVCVGLAILCPVFSPSLFLYDLKVNQNVRGMGIGKGLIDEAYKIANQKGYNGLYTVGQDNNLNACLFYLANGFVIGGYDTEIYKGTRQEGKMDILFYKH